MSIPLLFLIGLGVICIGIGHIWCIVIAMRVNPMWLFPLSAGFVFALPMFAREHWSDAKNPIRLSVFGVTLLMGALVLLLMRK